MKRVLGIDYGMRRIGVAVSDPLRVLARRLTTIERTSDVMDDAAGDIARLCEEHDADTIVVGCPRRTDGRFSDIEMQARAFADVLRERTDCRVELFDERYTSVMASRIIRETSSPDRRNRPSREKRGRQSVQKPRDKALVDRIAAEILLQDWLDSQRRSQ